MFALALDVVRFADMATVASILKPVFGPTRVATRRPIWLLLGLVVLGWQVLGILDRVLGQLHPVAFESHTAASLTGLGFSVPGADKVGDVLDTWSQGAPPSYTPIVDAYIAVDTLLFLPAYTLLLLLVVSRLEDRLAAARTGSAQAAAHATVQRARWCVYALAVVDLLENGAMLALVHTSWASGLVAWAAFLLAWAKVTLALLVLLSLVGGALNAMALDRPRYGGAWSVVLQLRGHLAVVLLLGALLLWLGLGADQTADVIRRWPDEWGQATIALALVAFVAVLMLTSTRTLVRGAAPQARRLPGTWPLLVAAGLLGVIALFWVLVSGDGIGLAALATILVVIALVNAFTGGGAPAGSTADEAPAQGTPLVARGPDAETEPPGATLIPALLAAAVLVLAGMAVMSTAVGELAVRGWGMESPWVLLVLIALGLQAAGWSLLVWRDWMVDRFTREAPVGDEPPSRGGRLRRRVAYVPIVLASALGVGVAFGAGLRPVEWGQGLGAIAVLFMCAAVLVVLATGLAALADRLPPGTTFRFLRLSRIPLFTMLVAWLVIASLYDGDAKRAQLATIDTAEADRRLAAFTGAAASSAPASVEQAFALWYAAQRDSGGGRGRALPLVTVVGSGGGARAAYWTARTIDCIVDGEAPSPQAHGAAASACAEDADVDRARAALFAASGVSGSSLGLVQWAAHVIDPPADPDRDWLDDAHDDDHLGPALLRGVFVDLPLAFIRANGSDDRARTLGESWERAWPSAEGRASPLAAGFLALQARGGRGGIPFLLLNGTIAQDGCRFNASSFNIAVDTRQADDDSCLGPPRSSAPAQAPDAGPGQGVLAVTRDLPDYLCGQRDIPLSAAALLSARFPYISPSARVVAQDGCTSAPAPANVVDGGYFDNTGASAALQFTNKLAESIERHNARDEVRSGAEPCVVQFLLVADNHYSDPRPAGDSRPGEALIPPLTALRARGTQEDEALQAAILAFQGAMGSPGVRAPLPGRQELGAVQRSAILYPEGHAGAEAPLGWTLSESSRTDLTQQLANTANRGSIALVRSSWLSDRLTCALPPADPPAGSR